MKSVTAKLRNAVRYFWNHKSYSIVGQVYGDTKGRFADGAEITTSKVLSEEGNVVITRNSIYEVETWFMPPSVDA